MSATAKRSESRTGFLRSGDQRGRGFLSLLVALAVVGAGGYWAFLQYGDRLPKQFRLGAGKKDIQRTQGCESQGPVHLVLPLALREKYRDRTLSKAIALPSNCLTVGEEVPIDLSWNFDNDMDRTLVRINGAAQIKGLQLVALDQLGTEDAKAAGISNLERYKESLRLLEQKLKQPTQDAVVVDFELKYKSFGKILRTAPDELNFARNLTAAEAGQLMNEGATLVDIRSDAEFAKHHDPRAVHLQYVVGVKGGLVKPSAFEGKDQFSIQSFSADKNQPVIVLGDSVFDETPLRALWMLKSQGWTRLYWLRGGEMERMGLPVDTEGAYPGIKTVLSQEVLSSTRDPKTLIIDVRPAVSFASGHIPGAVNAPYIERSTDIRKASDLKTPNFKSARDEFVPPASRGGTIVVYGIDRADMAPVKAALWIKEAAPSAKVSWLRDGIQGWKSESARGQAGYPLEGAQQPAAPLASPAVGK